RQGTKHSNVDAFTRVFAESEGMPDRAFISSLKPMTILTWKELKEAQEQDSVLRALRERGRGTTRDGVVGIGRKTTWRPILPKSIIVEVLKKWHVSPLGAHLGARKLLSTVSMLCQA